MPTAFIDEFAPTGLFAISHADTTACGGHRIFLQKDTQRVFRLSIADIIDIARHIDLGRAGLNAGGGHVGHAVLSADWHMIGHFLFDLFTEVMDDLQKGDATGLPQPTKGSFLHLVGEHFDVVEIERCIKAAPHLVQRVPYQHSAHATGRTGAA